NSDAQVPLLARAAAVVGTLLVNEELRYQADRNVQGQLLRNLRDGSADEWESTLRRAKPFGLNPGATTIVLALSLGSNVRGQRAIHSLVDRRGGLVAEIENLFLI